MAWLSGSAVWPGCPAQWRSVRKGGDTKTRKSRRTLALPDEVVRVLVAHQERQHVIRDPALRGNLWTENDLVFCDPYGKPLSWMARLSGPAGWPGCADGRPVGACCSRRPACPPVPLASKITPVSPRVPCSPFLHPESAPRRCARKALPLGRHTGPDQRKLGERDLAQRSRQGARSIDCIDCASFRGNAGSYLPVR